jgi:2-C-methyl-D-erythritol 4-phosphate cytidylyltransferase/2-C-methyl-D-erythritol 2,4-cyclodiphosphate synthase
MFEGLRIGTGFDVHPFKKGRTLMLGGIKIEHSKGLDGHSDADVLIHAIVDAILGALALGDIGKHFPPSDPQWRNASSSKFLEYALKKVKERDGKILSIDSTILAEEPKLAPSYELMRKNLASLLDLPLDRISVKATTTEKLGFVGRSEGMAAQAVCLLHLGRAT